MHIQELPTSSTTTGFKHGAVISNRKLYRH